MTDSFATAQMMPHPNDLVDYKDMAASVQVAIADGKTIRLAGTGLVR